MAKRSKPEDIEESVQSWLANSSVDAAAEYAARGRKHRDLSDTHLLDGWVSSFKVMAEDYSAPALRSDHGDYRAELEMRGLEAPFDRVKEESERYIAEAIKTIERLQKEEPDRFDKMALSIAIDVENHEKELKKLKQ